MEFFRLQRRINGGVAGGARKVAQDGPGVAGARASKFAGASFPSAAQASVAGGRDVRIDFFRGIALLVIFVAHVPGNAWDPYMPTRFGFSDAADIFVFCSGLASGIAYGGAYQRSNFFGASARVAVRCWQVYWAHICLFTVVAAMMVAADLLFAGGDTYVKSLNLRNFFTGDTGANLLGLVTLTYVPNLFDILPLYVMLLAMIPVVMVLSRFGSWVPVVCCVALWLVATSGYLQFPAEPWSDRTWQFHPLAWQLLFFAGFAFTRGWLPAPKVTKRLLWIGVAMLVIMAPIAFWPFARTIDVLRDVALTLGPWSDKPGYGILRIVHFTCLAYVAYCLAGAGGSNLKGRMVEVVSTVGRHSLGVFMTGIVLSMMAGIILNELGRPAWVYPAVNITGWAVLICTAYLIGWIKSKPWSGRVRARHAGADRGTDSPESVA